MALHNCEHTFESLATEVFPRYFESLMLAEKISLNELLLNNKLITECSGCYVMFLHDKAQYVGIAKNLRRRIQDHLSNNPSRANLTVRISAKDLNVKLSGVKSHPDFINTFNLMHDYLINNFLVSWVEIENPLEMYIFEPYCAMKLDTNEYNFFDTLQILSPKSK